MYSLKKKAYSHRYVFRPVTINEKIACGRFFRADTPFPGADTPRIVVNTPHLSAISPHFGADTPHFLVILPFFPVNRSKFFHSPPHRFFPHLMFVPKHSKLYPPHQIFLG
jgi:hypothetical protein